MEPRAECNPELSEIIFKTLERYIYPNRSYQFILRMAAFALFRMAANTER